jgi:hypothetical protein
MIPRTPALVLLSLIVAAAGDAHANGASWRWAKPTGTPGPVRAEGLVLEKEEVVFKDGKVTASFSVKNISAKPITTAMGFPLSEATDRKRGWSETEEDGPAEYVERKLKGFSVEVNGKRVGWKLATKLKGQYPMVIGWRMTYPPGALTAFTVRYPIRYSFFEGRGGEVFVKYITHTGAYWARPIGEAVFRFCDKAMIALYLEAPTGREWSHDGWGFTDYTWTIHPPDFSLDRESRCLVWRRKAWTPKPRVDDLEVGVRYQYTKQDFPERPRLLDHWCGRYEFTGYDDDERAAPDDRFQKPSQQLAAELGLDRAALDEARFERAEKRAWARLRHNRRTLTLASAPPHFRLLVRKQLLEYLRNYPYGIRDHAFKSDALRSCFEKVKGTRRGPLDRREAASIAFVRKAEARTAEELKAELGKLRRAPRTYRNLSTIYGLE